MGMLWLEPISIDLWSLTGLTLKDYFMLEGIVYYSEQAGKLHRGYNGELEIDIYKTDIFNMGYGERDIIFFFNGMAKNGIISSYQNILHKTTYRIKTTPLYPCIKYWSGKAYNEDIKDIYDLITMDRNCEYTCFYRKNTIPEKKEPQKKEPRVGNVYLMKNERNGYIKIGFTTKNPKVRESTLQSEEPEVTLIKSYTGKMSQEKHLHKVFSDKRIRGEWFELDEEDIGSVDKYFIQN